MQVSFTRTNPISIHAPREGCDARKLDLTATYVFQSTHPVRGATLSWRLSYRTARRFQSTHPVRGATASKTERSTSP